MPRSEYAANIALTEARVVPAWQRPAPARVHTRTPKPWWRHLIGQ